MAAVPLTMRLLALRVQGEKARSLFGADDGSKENTEVLRLKLLLDAVRTHMCVCATEERIPTQPHYTHSLAAHTAHDIHCTHGTP